MMGSLNATVGRLKRYQPNLGICVGSIENRVNSEWGLFRLGSALDRASLITVIYNPRVNAQSIDFNLSRRQSNLQVKTQVKPK